MKKIIQLLLITTLIVFSQKSHAQVPEQDSSALVAFYNSTDGANWTDNTNWLTGQVSTWAGITVIDGRVYTVELPSNNLIGNIPIDIGNLTGLRNIILNDNQLTGEIPTEIGLLTELSVLVLTNNQMSGSIPVEVENLNMTNLSLGSNNFSGSVPSGIGTWEVLYNLHLYDNQFTDLPALPGLPEGTVVRVENNRFEFDDLEPNINILTSYSPQDSIGVAETKIINLGEELALSITTGGTQNSYKWFKYSSEITGQTNAILTISNAALSDAGVYHAEVNNSIIPNLTLIGRPTKVNIDNPGLVADSLALVQLLVSTGGFQWNNATNWLDGPVSTWYGVTVTNGRVSRLDLSNNNLVGSIPLEIFEMSKLTVLSLENNKLENLPGSIPLETLEMSILEFLSLHNNKIKNLPNLSDLPLSGLSVENNKLEFDDIEPNISIPLFTYWPQDSIPFTYPFGKYGDEEEIVLEYGADIKFLIHAGGHQNTVKWYKNDEEIPTGPTFEGRSQLYIPHITLSDTGVYHAEITNSLVPNLTLIGGPTKITIANPGRVADSVALVQLFVHHGWKSGNDTWRTYIDMSYWKGVTVTNGRVTQLDFSYKYQDKYPQLAGSIHPVIGNLTSLESLNLKSNALTGGIPKEIGNLTALTTLVLSDNKLTGSIPPEIGNLTLLRDLHLGFNLLVGTIPTEIGNLTTLTSLHLNSNKLTGLIPYEVSNLTALTQLVLSGNELTGTIPPWIGNLTLLRDLHLDNNLLVGTIPTEIGNLAALTSLVLNSNELTGSIPPEIGNLTALITLVLNSNKLNGSIPPEIGNLTLLRHLHLGDNFLVGNIPTEIGQLTELESMDLGENRLTGDIPEEIKKLDNLKSLDFHRNELTGNIPDGPHYYIYWYGLISLDLSHNNLTGKIPSSFKNMRNLQYLKLNNNSLSGWIPQGILKLKLKLLDFSSNRLGSGNFNLLKSASGVRTSDTSDISIEIGNLTDLEVFDISDNLFTGVLPREIGLLDSLKVFKVGHNQLSGELPEEIGNLTTLDTLILTSNSFSGEMPLSMTNLTNLTFFNFDSTQLVVPNDTSFQNWLVDIPDSITTSIEIDDSKNIIPTEYLLEQNYPNPFNPTTTIEYSIPTVNVGASHDLPVQLKIYDLLGREVVELVNENQSAGNYEVQFDASNLTSGIYFYRLQTGDFTQIKKMILMK